MAQKANMKNPGEVVGVVKMDTFVLAASISLVIFLLVAWVP
jgi:hypothetical protein